MAKAKARIPAAYLWLTRVHVDAYLPHTCGFKKADDPAYLPHTFRIPAAYLENWKKRKTQLKHLGFDEGAYLA